MTQPSSEPGFRTAAERKRLFATALADPAKFCALVDIVQKDKSRTKFRLNATQKRSLRERTARTVILKARQIGQTTLELALDVHHVLRHPGANCVVVCQSITGHGPRDTISKRLEVMFEGLERVGIGIPFLRRSSTYWLISHGKDKPASTLQVIEAGASAAAARKKGRADTITRLHLTETASWEFAEETLNALEECVPKEELGSNEIVSESTPFGASGKFFEQCQEAMAGRSGYDLQFFPWFESHEYEVALAPGEVILPQNERQRVLAGKHGVRPEQLKWYQRKLAEKGSQELVDQEYPSDPITCFLTSGRHFFDAQKIALLVAKAEPPALVQNIRATGVRQQVVGRAEVPALRVFHAPVFGAEYVVACDTSEGSGGNAGAAVVYERGSGRHMATLWGQFKPWELAHWAAKLGKKYGWATIVVERNNHGHTVLRSLAAEDVVEEDGKGRVSRWRYPPEKIFHDRDKKPGWLTGPASRPLMLDAFEKALRTGAFETSDVFMLGQMNTFDVNEKGKAEARKGADDDLVMAGGIGWDVVCRVGRRRSEVQDYVP